MDVQPGYCDCSMCCIRISTLARRRAQLIESLASVMNHPATGIMDLQQCLDKLRIVDETNDSTAQELTIESERPGADEEIRTVFNDPATFNVKHPLYSSWTLWFDSPSTKNRGNLTGFLI
jgi:hypothetical protein